MPIERKQLAGIIDTDNSEYVVAPSFATMARNGVFRGNPSNLRFENIAGTTLIANSLPSGPNLCIGAFFDNIKKRIFYFNWNSNAVHGIYILSTQTGAVTSLIENGVGTNGDVLQFATAQTIYNVNIIYGDLLQGDVLYWINSQNQPCKINIDRQLISGYGTIQRSFLNVIKAPFDIPPQAAYENDSTLIINNLRKKVFKFKYRPIYDDNDKGVWSAPSVVPMPLNSFDTNVDSVPTLNGKISLVIQTGKSNVKKIEIAAAEGIGVVFSDFYSIDVLDKAQLNIPSDDIYIYRFLNDKAYSFIDLTESVQLFDLVPLQSNAQELLNGNSLIYGGILEGYNLLASLGSSAATVSAINNFRTQATDVLFAVQSGNTIGIAGGNIHIVVIGIVNQNDVFNVYTTSNTITYTAAAGNTTTDVINGLSANASGQGFTIVSSDANNLTISKAAQQLLRFKLVAPTAVLGMSDGAPVYDWWSRGALALQYFDADGITNGSQITNGFSFQTTGYTESGGVAQIPQLTLSIYHQPPLEAHYYSIGRTKDLSKTKVIQFISDRTFKDDSATIGNYRYAYLSLASLKQYIAQNPASSFLDYDFTPGDRIRLIKLYPSGGLTTPQIYSNEGFEIQGLVDEPTINDVVQKGSFVKIFLPTTTSVFDFGVQSPSGTPIDYSNYFYEIYTPAKSANNNLNFYYDFGERYVIGNAGTPTRFHQGMNQNQSTDYVTAATFTLTQGDYYLRYRKIVTTPILKYTIASQDFSGTEGGNSLFFLSALLDSNFNVAGYNSQSTSAGSAYSSSLHDSNNWDINITDGNSYTYNVKGAVVFKTQNYTSFAFNVSVYFTKPDGTVSSQILATTIPPTVTGTQLTLEFNTDVVIPAGYDKVFLLYTTSDIPFNNSIVSGEFTFSDTGRTFNQIVIDPNFSDSFQSSVNSNGRAFIFDYNAKQSFYGNLHRYGLNYQPDTNINQSNRFYDFNFIESDLSRGSILRYKTRGQELRFFFNRGVGRTGIYSKYIQNNSGTNQLVTTDDILTKNNVDYYIGEHGLGDQPTGLVSSASADYFIDPVTGDHIKVTANNGMESVSNLFWGKYYLRSLFTPYNKTWSRADGSNAKILGCYNFLESQCIMLLQGGSNGGNTINDYAFSFNEQRNGYDSFYDFHPEMIVCAETMLYSWLNGNIYVHDNVAAYTNFYGTQYYPSIDLVFNKEVSIKKSYNTIGYQSNKIWESPDNGNILTSMINEQTGFQQISSLLSVDYVLEENIRTAAFLFDANSNTNPIIGLTSGDFLKGNYLKIKLVYRGFDFSYIYLPYITWSVSQRNF